MKTRLAPSPTGALHLGNARTFLVNWALARRNGWNILLRIEDLDGPRIKPEARDGILETLEWLGLDWDEGPLVQSDDPAPYAAALETLVDAGAVFPCALTRGEIAAAASAPQEGAHELRYPPELRPKAWERSVSAGSNWRFAVAPGATSFVDGFAGAQSVDVSRAIGDFIVWTKRGAPAYQLAVVVDDHRQGITHVARGDDLLDSAARQLLLYRALGYSPEPSYIHLPLVVGPDGKRLAKRHGEGRIDALRAAGWRPERLIGLLARWCGLSGKDMTASEFKDAFELPQLSRKPVVFAGLASLLLALAAPALALWFGPRAKSAWREKPVTVDGREDDWRSKETVDDEGLSFALENDALDVFVMLAPHTRSYREQLSGYFQQDITVWFDPKAGMDKKVGLRLKASGGDAPRDFELVHPEGKRAKSCESADLRLGPVGEHGVLEARIPFLCFGGAPGKTFTVGFELEPPKQPPPKRPGEPFRRLYVWARVTPAPAPRP